MGTPKRKNKYLFVNGWSSGYHTIIIYYCTIIVYTTITILLCSIIFIHRQIVSWNRRFVKNKIVFVVCRVTWYDFLLLTYNQ